MAASLFPQQIFTISRTGACALALCLSLSNASSGAAETKSKALLNKPAQIGEWIVKCWQAPSTEPPQTVEATIRVRFSRTGAVIGEPRVVYVKPAGKAALKEEISKSVLAAVKACTPLPISEKLGASIAGRMLAIRLNSLPVTGRLRETWLADQGFGG
jgi:hypothetical protein